jgi:hypothetical protein
VSRYCDLLLKKSSKNPEDAELEETLNQVPVLYFYLNFVNETLSFFVLNPKVGGPQIANPQICGLK